MFFQRFNQISQLFLVAGAYGHNGFGLPVTIFVFNKGPQSTALSAQVAAIGRQQVLDLRRGSVFVVSNPFDNQRCATRAVGLIRHLFKRRLAAAHAARHCPLDIVVGHINAPGPLNRLN